jgi:quercetin dioxygenase-like cupin family protein
MFARENKGDEIEELVHVVSTPVALLEDGRPPLSTPAMLDRLARHLARNPVEPPVQHHFSPGVYAREMFIEAGIAAIGKVHKYENMLIMSQGVAELLVDGRPQRIKAPHIWVSPPGTQRAVYAITDCVFVSVHGTHKTDLAEIEEEFIAQTTLEYEQFRLTLQAEGEK